MRKILAVAIGFFLLSGCDNNQKIISVQEPEKKPYEEYKFDCQGNSGRVECVIVAGDLLGSGKWHHATIYMYSGNVDAKIDGVHYSKSGFSSDFYEGDKYSSFELTGDNGWRAEVTIIDGKNGSKLSVDAWDKDHKKFMSAIQR